MHVLGIDVGGSGIKGAPVDTDSGTLLAPRVRLATPASAKPDPMAQLVGEIARQFDWQGPVGVGFPSALHQGIVLTAANIHKKWIGVNAAELFSNVSHCPVSVINDADAAGIAEMRFGAGRGRRGLVLLITIGTGLGTALFIDGTLVPNTELGHIEIECGDAELRASDAARKREHLSWKKWGRRLNQYLQTLERLLWPDLFILGGGVIKNAEKFLPSLTLNTEVLPAELLNDAGIVGAALHARQLLTESSAP
jgi:polyphosphate glucokinase